MTHLSFLAGDFNSVASEKDRWSTIGNRWAENGDNKDSEVLSKVVLGPGGLVEWEQSHFTCEVKGARSKLDRIYVNQHVSFHA